MSAIKSCPECGAVFVSARSIADHRRFFGLLRAAYMHWPESHPFKPDNEESLRAWALVESGHHDVDFIAYPEECQETPAIKTLFRLAVEATHAACYRKRGYAAIRVSAGGIEILTPKSIDFRLSQKEFGPIREAVEGIIESALGVSANQLLRERAA